MPSAIIWTELHELAVKASKVFGFRAPRIEPMHRRWRCKMDGDSYRGRHPLIRLRVHRYHRPHQPLKRSTIMASFAHELAHLVPGCWDHGVKHRAKTEEIAAWLREQGQPVWNVLHHGSYYIGARSRRRNKRRNR